MINPTFKLLPEAVGMADADGKPAILAALSEKFAEVYSVGQAEVLDALEEREALGSTGFGRGVAIPHARIDTINRPVAAVLRLAAPVAFDAADGLPVDLVFGLLSPSNAGVSHLHALAAISRLVRDDNTHQALAEAANGEELYATIANVTDRDVA